MIVCPSATSVNLLAPAVRETFGRCRAWNAVFFSECIKEIKAENMYILDKGKSQRMDEAQVSKLRKWRQSEVLNQSRDLETNHLKVKGIGNRAL